MNKPERLALAAVVAVSSLSVVTDQAAAATCRLPDGILSIQDVPEGSSVGSCPAVGRYVDLGGASLPIPAPGHGIDMYLEYPTYGESYSITTDPATGRVDYDHQGPAADARRDGFASEPVDGAMPRSARLAADPRGCDRSTYQLLGDKQYGTWRFWIGDGAQPAAGTRTQTANAARRAATNIAASVNSCGFGDQTTAFYSYEGRTSLESDIVTIAGRSVCPAQHDSTSTVDAGNLDENGTPPIAGTCTWRRAHSGRDAIVQADVRLNTTDYDFTYAPSSPGCHNKYDVEGIMTHELGHVYGLADLTNPADKYLTMYGAATTCSASKRTLGRGDVLGLRQLY